ncbi:MAG: LacI family DNA-binding transcriptional regulator [Candidatus Solibacter sp.]|nr:LacI family DNA-binding transcriptional regulator [Candidatus Solibacter sp.]
MQSGGTANLRTNLSHSAKLTSIKDIARVARVSHSTVSRALSNSPLVNQKTAEKIRRIARDSGYRASAVARSLVTRRSHTIGVVVTNIADPFVAGVVSGIEETAEGHGFSVFLANSNAEPEREVRVVRSFEERRVDGIIVTASRVGARYVPLLSNMRVPIVLLNNQHPSQFAHSVMIANIQASLDATRHLIELGHRRIAYLGDRGGHQSETERFTGYRQALEAAGLRLNRRLVTQGDGKPEAAKGAMAHLLALPQPPTAVFCYNDLSALGAIRQIRDSGLHVPGDISVVGFDDLYISQYMDPPLTTVRQPMRQMGCMAMQTLLDIFAEAESGHDIKVPGELIVRASTAPPKEKS